MLTKKEKQERSIEKLLAVQERQTRKIKKVRGDFSEIVFYSFRYCLGRRTFAPRTCSVFIRTNIELINNKFIKLMIKEIGEYEDNGFLGHKCAIETWTNLRVFLCKEIDEQRSIRDI